MSYESARNGGSKSPPPPQPTRFEGVDDGDSETSGPTWAPGYVGSAAGLATQAGMDRSAEGGASTDSTDAAGGAADASSDLQRTDQAWQGAGFESADDDVNAAATPDPWTDDPGYDADWVRDS